MKKAAASVKEVTVIATPACFIAWKDNDGILWRLWKSNKNSLVYDYKGCLSDWTNNLLAQVIMSLETHLSNFLFRIQILVEIVQALDDYKHVVHTCFTSMLHRSIKVREGWRYQIGWLFGKISNGLRRPPPFSYSENYIANFFPKSPKFFKIKFWIKMAPHLPPLEFSRKFIQFGIATLP